MFFLSVYVYIIIPDAKPRKFTTGRNGRFSHAIYINVLTYTRFSSVRVRRYLSVNCVYIKYRKYTHFIYTKRGLTFYCLYHRRLRCRRLLYYTTRTHLCTIAYKHRNATNFNLFLKRKLYICIYTNLYVMYII